MQCPFHHSGEDGEEITGVFEALSTQEQQVITDTSFELYLICCTVENVELFNWIP